MEWIRLYNQPPDSYRKLLGLDSSVNIEFKWCDNMQDEGNIMDFYVSGDVAPGGRFNYVYTSDWQK